MDEYEPCERCGESRILDGAHRICFDCFIELDLEFHEKELLKELSEDGIPSADGLEESE